MQRQARLHAPLRRTLRGCLSLALVLGASALAPAEAQQKSDAEVRDEIAFARGLASEWGFVDMAQRVVEEAEAAGVSDRMREELALLKCDLYFEAARNNVERRNELLREALASYQRFVERHAYSELLDRARAQLVSVAGAFARSLSRSLEEATGEEAAAIRTEMQSVLDASISLSNELVAALRTISLDERSEAQNQRLYDLLLNLGDMYLELARTQDEATFSFGQSFKAYEDLVDEAGEASPAGLRAFVGIGDNLVAQEEYADAASYYEFVVDLAIPRKAEDWAQLRDQMSAAELEKRFLFLQLATAGLVESLVASNQAGEAAEWGLHFYNVWKAEGLNLQQPLGYLSLLAVARSLVDAGGFIGGEWSAGAGRWFETREEMLAAFPARRQQRTALEVALSMAQTVNEDNRGNTLQFRAQKVISEIISRPGVEVDPEILFEAAQGRYFARDYADAIDAFKEVLAALEHVDQAKRIEIGPKVLFHMGRCYQQLDRLLEAAVTFQVALDRFRGDPEFDVQNARQLFETVRALQRQMRGDQAIESMYKRAEELFAQVSEVGAAEKAYRDAEEAFAAGDFAKAKGLFEQVPFEASSYEKARVFSGVSSFKLDQLDAAEEVFDTYLNGYLEDPKNQTTDAQALARRAEAQATAVFYWGLTAFQRAEQDGSWQKVVEQLKDFETRFPEQTSFAPAAMFRLMVAHDRLDRRADVRAVYERMLKLFPENRWTGLASAESYRSLKERYEANQDEAQRRVILREMAENLQVLNRTASVPSFNNMKTEANHWMALREYATAEELLLRIVERFAESEATDVDKFILPDLGEAQLRLGKAAEAAATLEPLVSSKKATRKSAQYYARALAGWADYVTPADGGEPELRFMPGVGGEEQLAEATEVLKQLDGVAEKWTSDWYDFKFDLLFAYREWGKLDSKKLEVVKSQLGFLSSPANLGPTFQHDQMPEGLRQKYLWLAQEVR